MISFSGSLFPATRRLAIAMAAALVPSLASAVGILVPRDASFSPIQLGKTDVRTEIRQNLAKTRVVQEFHNPNPRQLEADFFFPVPKGADVTDFVLYMNGQPVKGEVLEKQKAREIYEGIVRRMQDPGLLEWVDYNLFKVRVFPVPASGTQKIELEFAQPLQAEQGTFKYTFPLRTPKSAPLRESGPEGSRMQFRVDINSDEPIRNVYSPSHPIDADLKNPKSVHVTVKSVAAGSGDLVIFYEPSGKDIALSLVATRPDSSADGFFSLMLSPPIKPASGEVIPQDVTFVIDTSGSMMESNKIEQARRALTYCVGQLRPVDRFALVRFSTETEKFREGLIPATPENIESAKRWITELQARGGTNISGALQDGLNLRQRGLEDRATTGGTSRLYTMVFVTDGLPTVGQTDPNQILEAAKTSLSGGSGTPAGGAKTSEARIFTFGVGNDVNTKLLDRLAEETRAAADYIRPGEDMEVPISRFFDKISQPAMTGLRLEMPGADVYDLYPKELPDLFFGSQLTVFGRYKKAGPTAVRLTGSVSGKPAEFVYEKTLPSTEPENRFVEKLWGTRKIAYLLDSIRQAGESQEAKDEVIQLAKKYGVVTPYTSYLVTEDTPGAPPMTVAGAPPAAAAPVMARDMAAESSARTRVTPSNTPRRQEKIMGQIAADSFSATASGAAAPMAARASFQQESGAGAVAASKQIRSMKDAQLLESEAKAGTRMAAGLTFQLINGVWTDTRVEAASGAKLKLKPMSAAYFEALRLAPRLSEVFALGDHVRIQLPGGILEVSADGKEALEEADRAFLAGAEKM